MRYVVDLDGTLCSDTGGRYEEAVPLGERIEQINALTQSGATVVIHTARGMGRSGGDAEQAEREFRGMTMTQLEDWGVLYDELVFGKPAGDVYVDDKAARDSDFFQIKEVPKGWGYELWIVNKPEYCGKLLFFEEHKRCSFHYHELKDETFYVQSGSVVVRFSFEDDLLSAHTRVLEEGDRMHIPPGMRHQIVAMEDTELFEFSTQHFDEDSYRIVRGD